jgi:hypothetical protein
MPSQKCATQHRANTFEIQSRNGFRIELGSRSRSHSTFVAKASGRNGGQRPFGGATIHGTRACDKPAFCQQKRCSAKSCEKLRKTKGTHPNRQNRAREGPKSCNKIRERRLFVKTLPCDNPLYMNPMIWNTYTRRPPNFRGHVLQAP